MMKKLLSEVGETMVESMVSMVIIVLVFVFLTNAVVTAARVNDSLKSEDVTFSLPEGAVAAGTVEVTIQGEKARGNRYEAPYGENGSRYYYYEYDGS